MVPISVATGKKKKKKKRPNLQRLLRGDKLLPEPGRAVFQSPPALLLDHLHLRFGGCAKSGHFRLALPAAAHISRKLQAGAAHARENRRAPHEGGRTDFWGGGDGGDVS